MDIGDFLTDDLESFRNLFLFLMPILTYSAFEQFYFVQFPSIADFTPLSLQFFQC